MSLDYKNAELPELLPLHRSFTQNEIEEQCKALFLETFKQTFSEDVFDVNVLGAAHLGSFESVRRSINADGLVLLQGDREEEATRYLYRAWKARNCQGRGFHFLRTYLQLLFPNICEVYQCWQDKQVTYPTGLYKEIPADRSVDDFFLTSRFEIALTFDVNVYSLKGLRDIIRSIVPARLLPDFRFLIIFELAVKPKVDYFFEMEKVSEIPLYGPALYVTDNLDYQFTVREDNPEKLGYGQIQKDLTLEKVSEVNLSRIIRVGQPDLKVDGLWNVSYGALICEGSITVTKDS